MPPEKGFIGIKGLQTSQDSKERKGRGVEVAEGGRQQTEMRQSQAMLPQPREGAASIEGRRFGTRGPHGSPFTSTQVEALPSP